ncbi:hypothetical protein CEXT_464271 [Caerostris extrusa]|uniref:Uncharacterized protein n=1 Tax=Caerostris extrusa TaxID=172846 RepID=A0AAV4NTV0_CAEEX|nr:hypothetical protein CEXT_464271 [Caerostris extrusa]
MYHKWIIFASPRTVKSISLTTNLNLSLFSLCDNPVFKMKNYEGISPRKLILLHNHCTRRSSVHSELINQTAAKNEIKWPNCSHAENYFVTKSTDLSASKGTMKNIMVYK